MRIKAQSGVLCALLLGSCLAVALLFPASLSAQCQMCRTALTQSEEGQRWSRGINAGILLILAAPFLIGGSIALVIYRSQLPRALARVRGGFKASK
jgi:hypothetical protein